MWNVLVEWFCFKKKRLVWFENIEIGLLSVMVLFFGRKCIELNIIIKEKDIRKNFVFFSLVVLFLIIVVLGYLNLFILVVNYMIVILYL